MNEIENQPNLHTELEQKVVSIDAAGVHTQDKDGKMHVYEADTIIVAVGLAPLKDEVEAFRELAPQVSIVGDCNKAAQMNEAILAGYFAGYNLQRL